MLKINFQTLLLALMLTVSNSFAQNSRKNSIGLKTTLYNFLDGSPMFQLESHIWQQRVGNGFGIDYRRVIKNQNYWSLSLNSFYFDKSPPFDKMKMGDVLRRSFLHFTGSYQNKFFTKNKHELYWELGTGIRVGSESYFLDLYQFATWGEVSARKKILFDLGLFVGLNYKYNFGKTRFSFASSFQASIFPYTFDKKDSKYYFDVAPNWKMLYFSIGVGYEFGKLKKL